MNDAAKSQITTGGPLAALVPTNIDEAFRLSQALAGAGDMVPKHFQGKPQMVMAAIARGMEVGMAPMQALASITVINGRAAVWGDAIPALLQRAGHSIDASVNGEGDTMVAVATVTRGDTGQTIERSFSVDDAKLAGLWKKQGPWQTYPKRMLEMRARALAARDGAADALMGLQVSEEMRDVPRMRDVTPAPRADGPNLAQRLQGPVEEQKREVSELTAFPGSDEYSKGQQAYTEGLGLTDCPYDDGSQKMVDWCGGWMHERNQADEAGE